MNLLDDFAKNILFLFYSLTKLKKIDLAHFLRDLEKHQSHGVDLVEWNLRKKWMTAAMQRRNEGLPTMQCGSLLFKITIFDKRMLQSC